MAIDGFFVKGPTPASFWFIFDFSNYSKEKNSVASGIQTRIIRVEGKDTDHNSHTTAHRLEWCYLLK